MNRETEPGPAGAAALSASAAAGDIKSESSERTTAFVFVAVCTLGISTMMTQLVLMRELLSAFSGNEVVLGIILGNWLLLSGLGTYLGKTAARLKRPISILIVAQLLIAVLPPADVFLLRTLRNVLFIRGAMVGVTETVAACFVLLLPYCVIAGYLLTLACSILARQRDSAAGIGRVYLLDNLGNILGGFLFSFVLVQVFDHFRILYVPAALNLLLAAVLAVVFRERVLLCAAAAVAAGAVALVATSDLDALSTKAQYAGQQVVYRGNSPYGDLVVTETAGQYNFIESGVPLFSTNDIEKNEEAVHYALAQRPKAERVLLISGGVAGTAREILKYPVKELDYVELDPLVVQVGRRFLPNSLDDPRIKVINTDGRLFVKRTAERFDVIITDLPDPATTQINRLYTREFFVEAKRRLAPGGVLSLGLGHYENFMSRELAGLVAVTHRTLREVFGNVLVIPGGRIFFLASDGPLDADVAARIEQAGVQTQFVRRSYLSSIMTPDRLADIQRGIAEPALANTDFSPVLYYYHLRYWISQFKFCFGLLEGLLAAALALYLFRIRAVPFAIFTTGFAAAALEVVILLAFQILYGSLYHQVGLIVTVFMAGLAIGSWSMNRRLERRKTGDLIRLQLALAGFAALLPLALWGLTQVGGAAAVLLAAQAAIVLLTLLLAVMVGMAFPLASQVAFEGAAATAARLYTADFVGACVGALLVSTLLIPLLGVAAVCWLTAALALAGGAAVWVKSRPG